MSVDYTVYIGPYLYIDPFVVTKKSKLIQCKNKSDRCTARHIDKFCSTCGDPIEIVDGLEHRKIVSGGEALDHILDVLGVDESTEYFYYSQSQTEIVIYKQNADYGLEIDPKYDEDCFEFPSDHTVSRHIENFRDDCLDITNYLDETGRTYHFKFGTFALAR